MINCPVCSSTDHEPWCIAWDDQYFTTAERFAYLRCRGCQALFIDPIPMDRLAEIYPTNYYAYSPQADNVLSRVKRWFDKRNFKRVLKQLSGTRLRVLDVGGGSGWQLDLLRLIDPRVAETCEVDLDPKGAELARNAGHEVFCGRIEDFRSPETFDLILLLNLIEHVPNPPEILRKVASLLKPGGLALVQTPNYDSLDARLFRHRNWGGYHCPRHFVLFESAGFSALCARSGLQVAQRRYTQGAPFWAWTCLGWLARLKVISLGKTRPSGTHPLFAPLCGFFAVFDFLRLPFSKTSQMRFLLKKGS